MLKILNSELGRPTLQEFVSMEKLPVTVVLDNVRSMNNVGSIFRTCDAFAVERIALCGITASPPDREIHKTALGAEDIIPWDHYASTSDAVVALREEGYLIIAVEQVEGAAMLERFAAERGVKYALVFGNEVFGVGQEVADICDHAIEIPQVGTKHSLNVAVSAGIVLWEFFRRLGGSLKK